MYNAELKNFVTMPLRYHDVAEVLSAFDDVVGLEFHLSAGDLEAGAKAAKDCSVNLAGIKRLSVHSLSSCSMILS